MKIVAVSGYFNPIHKGHIKLFEEARKLGDRLLVIVNNDRQRELKGSSRFMDIEERAYICSQIKGVNDVFISIDDDRTVCKTLELLKPHIFANGGDRTEDEIPETAICEKLGIEMVFGVGGEKIQSSSTLIQNSHASV